MYFTVHPPAGIASSGCRAQAPFVTLMRRVFCAVSILVMICALQSQAQSLIAISADDHTVVPGQRVGAITLYSSLSVLQGLFGTKNVKPKMQPLPSGDTTPGARLFEGTDLQLDLLWDEEGRDKRVVEVRLTGPAWTLQNGLKTGLSIDEVARINGRPFKINGFDWHYGGYASFDGGALAEGLGVRFAPTVVNYKHSLVGDKKLSSTDNELRAAVPVVTQIAVWLR